MKNQYIGRDCLRNGMAWTDHRFKEEGVVPLNVRSWYPNAHCDYFAPFGIIENRFTKINEMGNTVFSWAKRLIERWYLLITEKVLFWTFWWWKITSFLQPKSWWKDDIYMVFLSLLWYSRTWERRFSAQW